MWFNLPFFGRVGLFAPGGQFNPILTFLFIIWLSLFIYFYVKLCLWCRRKYYMLSMKDGDLPAYKYPKNKDGSIDAYFEEL